MDKSNSSGTTKRKSRVGQPFSCGREKRLLPYGSSLHWIFGWGDRLDAFLENEFVPSQYDYLIRNPDREAKNGLLELSVEYPQLVQEIEQRLADAKEGYELFETKGGQENLDSVYAAYGLLADRIQDCARIIHEKELAKPGSLYQDVGEDDKNVIDTNPFGIPRFSEAQYRCVDPEKLTRDLHVFVQIAKIERWGSEKLARFANPIIWLNPEFNGLIHGPKPPQPLLVFAKYQCSDKVLSAKLESMHKMINYLRLDYRVKAESEFGSYQNIINKIELIAGELREYADLQAVQKQKSKPATEEIKSEPRKKSHAEKIAAIKQLENHFSQINLIECKQVLNKLKKKVRHYYDSDRGKWISSLDPDVQANVKTSLANLKPNL